jgi:GTPase SAR1 family protein
MKFIKKFLLSLVLFAAINGFDRVHAMMEESDEASQAAAGFTDEDLEKICDNSRKELYTILKNDTKSDVVLITIGSSVSKDEASSDEASGDEVSSDEEGQELESQQRPYFFMQAAKNYPKNQYTIISIDPFLAEENETIQTEKNENLTTIKVSMCLFSSYQKRFNEKESKNEKEIFDGDVSAMKDYIKKIFDRKGAVIIADIAQVMTTPVIAKLKEIMTLTPELNAKPEDMKDMNKPYRTFASVDARFLCYDLFDLDDENGSIGDILQMIKTKDEQFKIFNPEYANIIGDIQWHDKK